MYVFECKKSGESEGASVQVGDLFVDVLAPKHVLHSRLAKSLPALCYETSKSSNTGCTVGLK